MTGLSRCCGVPARERHRCQTSTPVSPSSRASTPARPRPSSAWDTPRRSRCRPPSSPPPPSGRDLLVQSPTGSGKTLAFGVPIIERIAPALPAAHRADPRADARARGAGRCRPHPDRYRQAGARHGGVTAARRSTSRRRPCATSAIVVATPGRLDDLIRQRKIDLRAVRVLVLDEADRMLDMGFQPQVDAICESLPSHQRQTMLFSATLEGRSRSSRPPTPTDAEIVRTTVAPGAGGEIDHVMWATTGGTKVDTALEIARDASATSPSSSCAPSAAPTCSARACASTASPPPQIHGGMTQRERLREYGRFQDGDCDGARRDRRVRARHGPRPHHAGRQLRPARGRRHLPPPLGPHRPRGPHRHRDHDDHARAAQAGASHDARGGRLDVGLRRPAAHQAHGPPSRCPRRSTSAFPPKPLAVAAGRPPSQRGHQGPGRDGARHGGSNRPGARRAPSIARNGPDARRPAGLGSR